MILVLGAVEGIVSPLFRILLVVEVAAAFAMPGFFLVSGILFGAAGIVVGLLVGGFGFETIPMMILGALWLWAGVGAAAAIEAILRERLGNAQAAEYDSQLRRQYLRGAIHVLVFAAFLIWNNASEEEPSNWAVVQAVLSVVVYAHLGHLGKHRLAPRGA